VQPLPAPGELHLHELRDPLARRAQRIGVRQHEPGGAGALVVQARLPFLQAGGGLPDALAQDLQLGSAAPGREQLGQALQRLGQSLLHADPAPSAAPGLLARPGRDDALQRRRVRLVDVDRDEAIGQLGDVLEGCLALLALALGQDRGRGAQDEAFEGRPRARHLVEIGEVERQGRSHFERGGQQRLQQPAQRLVVRHRQQQLVQGHLHHAEAVETGNLVPGDVLAE
jgi:hypothetical protein